MRVEITEESYTSQASFLDGDPLPVYRPNDGTTYMFSGKRVKRGLYRASNGREINADSNGVYNIIRKEEILKLLKGRETWRLKFVSRN